MSKKELLGYDYDVWIDLNIKEFEKNIKELEKNIYSEADLQLSRENFPDIIPD